MQHGHDVPEVAHVGAGAEVVEIGDPVATDKVFGIGPEQLRHGAVLPHGEVAGDRGQLQDHAEGEGAGPESAVDLARNSMLPSAWRRSRCSISMNSSARTA